MIAGYAGTKTGRVDQAARGRVAEWSNAPVLKTGRGASLSWVRIPPLPPNKNAPLWGIFIWRCGVWTKPLVRRASTAREGRPQGGPERSEGWLIALRRADTGPPLPPNKNAPLRGVFIWRYGCVDEATGFDKRARLAQDARRAVPNEGEGWPVGLSRSGHNPTPSCAEGAAGVWTKPLV